jgi:hypothetical protein
MILVASKIGRLSDSVNALAAIVYPFSWQVRTPNFFLPLELGGTLFRAVARIFLVFLIFEIFKFFKFYNRDSMFLFRFYQNRCSNLWKLRCLI